VACEGGYRVTASDISPEAVTYARRNAVTLKPPVFEVWQGDLLEPLRRHFQAGSGRPPQIIAANPTYVTDNEVEHLTERGWPEPVRALAGGADGLDIVRRLVRDAAACLRDGGWLMVEIGPDQGRKVTSLFAHAGFGDVTLVRDLAGRDRVCRGRWYRA
jgi:release factor glutamine methyltransferase